MVFHNFDELIAHVKGQPSRARMAVAAAGDAHTIEAVLRARAEGIVTPILVGDKAVIDQVLVAPNIHAGNIMGKMLTVTCKAKMAGFIVGARCPIVMTSRGSSAEEKYLSIVISAAAARNQ